MIFRTADGNDEDNSQNENFNKFMRGIKKNNNEEFNQPNQVVGGGAKVKFYQTPDDNEIKENNINKGVMGNNYPNNNMPFNNDKINISFYYINNKHKKFKFIASSKDSFKNTITKMLNENSKYIELEDIKYFLFKGKACNMNKTLAEIGIKDWR